MKESDAMLDVPADIHSQIVDSFTQMPYSLEGTIVNTEDLPRMLEACLPLAMQPLQYSGSFAQFYADLEGRRARALVKTAELERGMSSQRMQITQWSNKLRNERRAVLNGAQTFQRHGASDLVYRHSAEAQRRVENHEGRDRILKFMQQAYAMEERSFLALSERLRRKYPMYQITLVNTLAEAIDSLVCTAEVCMEDANLMIARIANKRRQTDRLRNENRELVRAVQQLEHSLSSSFVLEPLESGLVGFPQPCDVQQLAEAGDDGGRERLSDTAAPADSKGSSPRSRKNLLDLKLETIKSRHESRSAA